MRMIPAGMFPKMMFAIPQPRMFLSFFLFFRVPRLIDWITIRMTKQIAMRIVTTKSTDPAIAPIKPTTIVSAGDPLLEEEAEDLAWAITEIIR